MVLFLRNNCFCQKFRQNHNSVTIIIFVILSYILVVMFFVDTIYCTFDPVFAFVFVTIEYF